MEMVLSKQDGSGLVLAILIVVALFVLGTSLAFLTRTDVNISGHQTRYVEAIYVAEAGVEEVLQRMALADPTNLTVNGSTINVAIRDTAFPPDPNWKVRVFLCRPGEEPSPTDAQIHTVTVQNASDWLAYSDPSDTLDAINIEHKWKDRDGDGVRDANEVVLYDGGRVPPENFVKGAPVEIITAMGKQASAERRIRVEATRLPLNANARAAVLCDRGVDIAGNVSICGHDHRMITPVYTQIHDCDDYTNCPDIPGSPQCRAAGCLYSVMTTGDTVKVVGSTDLDGNPSASPNTDSTNVFYTLAQTLGLSQEEVDEILASADYTDVDQDDPQEGITYVDNAGGTDAKWNNGNGTGLLYVTGDLEIAGNWTWKGLIYVEGDLKLTGTAWILGAVVVRGVSEYSADFSHGTPTVLYSSEALAYYLSQHLKYVKVGWKETSGL